MADPNMTVSLKRHSHPVLGALSLAALVLSIVALAKACPPVPAPAGAPVPVAEKPVAPMAEKPAAVPVPAPVVAPAVVAPVAEVKAPAAAVDPVSK